MTAEDVRRWAWDNGMDDLDVMMWEHQHADDSQHWAWKFRRTFRWRRGSSCWNGWLWNAAYRLDPPKGLPRPWSP